jgi:signal peptidase II
MRKAMKKNKNSVISLLLWFLAAAVIISADQAVKIYILNHYRPGEVFGSVKYIADFIYVQNTGAAFSIFSDQTIVLSIISVLFCIAIVVYKLIKKPLHPLFNVSLALMFAGAAGNAIDRVAYNFVVDFISIKWFDFPVFNIADIAIVAGAAAAVVYVIFFDKDTAEERN